MQSTKPIIDFNCKLCNILIQSLFNTILITNKITSDLNIAENTPNSGDFSNSNLPAMSLPEILMLSKTIEI